MASNNKTFKLKGKIFLLDDSLVELILSMFPWAIYRKTKGVAKLHVGLDADGYLPAFVDLTTGKEYEINWACDLNLPKSSLCCVRSRLYRLRLVQGACRGWRVLRHPAQSNAVVLPGKCRRGRKSPGVIEGRQIQLGNLPQTFRLVTYRDELKDIVYQFLTNALAGC